MTAEPEILRNAFNSETFVFYAHSGSSDMGRFRVILGDGGSGGGNALVHGHPHADETFDVVSGRLTIVVDGREQIVEAGQSATIPRGASHYFKNAHAGTTECTVTFSPSQQHQRFFRNFATLAQTKPKWFSSAGDPRLLLIALVLHSYRDHLYLAGVPIGIQKVLFAVLSRVARWRGYRLAIDPL
jgi:mannose-6-phosphate isomerase-like protein (cupin superfamily)